ncbi:hypothetical protein O9H85_01775 [Paenibacillus filicis]|uniref:DUF2157 domain-containing protein n=1 Tax=Paenibacillus gyeongsangnamensis TaxID=3388067 RepID=A0ABT4Q2Y4_9BACL|nr:hypothetical protein [Paenibacillus filicis]MCZ8511187.1 hypothetical protein [Paenibacillus filicis]
MEDKKKMVIREIEHWRRSRLLPEHYCDFLLNLYLEEGQEKPSSGGFLGITPAQIKNSNWKIWVLVFGITGVLAFTALHFNAFEFPMQIGVSLLFLALIYSLGGYKRNKEPLASQILLGMASLFLLFIGVYLLRIHGLDSPVRMVFYVVLDSLVWILTGLLARFALFQVCGWVSLVFCYGWLLHYQLNSLSWMTLELSWVPLSLLFCWIAWMVHERARQIGLVFFLVSLLVWYMPELYGMLYAESYGEGTVQWMLLAKLTVEGSLLFALRKKWTEWVA